MARFMLTSAALAALALPATAADSYQGSYTWLDMPSDNYVGKTLNMTLTPTDAGYRAELVADFGSKVQQMQERFGKTKTYRYQGELTGNMDQGLLSGTVSSEDGKMFWSVDLKFHQGRCIGMAKQSEGHQTWATFALLAATDQAVSAESTEP